ncbi:MAG: NAD-dependent epimerase/dehydratase family protein [Methanomicrobiales archaeon]|nr:NAD-dependent epimerase/dehydratase family protein [Methanomicrobiales archaeon]MDD1671265.1 NAD-dependent epimerase/dehydratase family protein [Methanomicrobiales archaeon]
MKRHLLITGGAGFIGSHLAQRCLSMGCDVTIIDNLATGRRENIPAGAAFIEGDISDGRTLDHIPPGRIDAVLHLAAQSSGEISNEHPDLDLRINTLGTLLLLLFCLRRRIPRFLYASSMAVYGDPACNPVSEGEPVRPLSFYGISKLASEMYVNHFGSGGLATTCFRMFSVYGPGQNLENMKQGMVSIFMAYLLEGKPVHVKGSGDRFRDFIYVDDVVEAWIRALDNPATYGKVYNLGTGVRTPVRELVREEILAFGLNPDRYRVNYSGSTPADQFGLYADISNLEKDLGWKPVISLNLGISRMVSWARGRDTRTE